MSKALDAFYRFLDEPIFPWARVVLALLTIFIGLSFTAPMWSLNMKAPQYPQGLDLYVYSYKVDGGNDGNDVQEINVLNHYIGMAPIDRAALADLDWIPFLFAGMIIVALRTAVIGKVGSMIDLLVLTTYAGIFGFGRLYFKLYTFGHDLDPKAPVTVDPFMPVIWGKKQIANFLTEAGPGLGTLYVAIFATGLTLLLLAHLVIGRRRHVRATSGASAPTSA
jgi:copper chaperone NosL